MSAFLVSRPSQRRDRSALGMMSGIPSARHANQRTWTGDGLPVLLAIAHGISDLGVNVFIASRRLTPTMTLVR